MNCCSKSKDIGLLVLRVFVGGTFVFHGVLKAMHMTEPQGTIDFFNQIGFSAFWAYVVTGVEIVGGIAVMLGLFSFYGALLLAIVMAVAAFKVKWTLPQVPFLGKYLASELDLSLLASLVAIMLVGPGKMSLGKGCGDCHKSCENCVVAKAQDVAPTV